MIPVRRVLDLVASFRMFHHQIPLISQSKCTSSMFFWFNLLNVYTGIHPVSCFAITMKHKCFVQLPSL